MDWIVTLLIVLVAQGFYGLYYLKEISDRIERLAQAPDRARRVG